MNTWAVIEAVRRERRQRKATSGVRGGAVVKNAVDKSAVLGVLQHGRNPARIERRR